MWEQKLSKKPNWNKDFKGRGISWNFAICCWLLLKWTQCVRNHCCLLLYLLISACVELRFILLAFTWHLKQSVTSRCVSSALYFNFWEAMKFQVYCNASIFGSDRSEFFVTFPPLVLFLFVWLKSVWQVTKNVSLQFYRNGNKRSLGSFCGEGPIGLFSFFNH